MSLVVATLPKGYAIAFASEDMDHVIKANGCTQLNNLEFFESWDDAILELNTRNEEIERKRSSSLVIINQGLKSIVSVNGDMNQLLASVTKFVCETMAKGGFKVDEVDKMIDLLTNHVDNIAELQSLSLKDMEDAVINDDTEYWEDEDDE